MIRGFYAAVYSEACSDDDECEDITSDSSRPRSGCALSSRVSGCESFDEFISGVLAQKNGATDFTPAGVNQYKMRFDSTVTFTPDHFAQRFRHRQHQHYGSTARSAVRQRRLAPRQGQRHRCGWARLRRDPQPRIGPGRWCLTCAIGRYPFATRWFLRTVRFPARLFREAIERVTPRSPAMKRGVGRLPRRATRPCTTNTVILLPHSTCPRSIPDRVRSSQRPALASDTATSVE